jgi:hypothetical protein
MGVGVPLDRVCRSAVDYVTSDAWHPRQQDRAPAPSFDD